jgi:hypothetical protein
MIAPNPSYISYGFKTFLLTRHPHRSLRRHAAGAVILHLIKKHNRLEFLPEHLLTIDSNNPTTENEDE